MDMVLAVVLIIAFLGIILLALIEGFTTHKQLTHYAQEIAEEAMFYFKSNPAITCTIVAVNRQGFENPNMILEVTYPDNSVGELITPMAEFQKLWIKE
jgi:uncharacterized protein (UPF0333 family)